jgi:uncharacterized protein (TIGR02391 family)
MVADDPILKKIDALIQEGYEVQNQRVTDSLFSDQELYKIPFFTWVEDVIQFIHDNINDENVYLHMFAEKVVEHAEKSFPQMYHVGLGIEILRRLKKYLIENPNYRINKKSNTHGHENKVKETEFENFLHPIIYKNAYRLFQNGDYRNAVLNSIIAVFDQIREKTGLEEDGERLSGKVFSLSNPYLVLSNLDTESGKNDQKGFLQIFQGAYIGIRNPKAHTLEHDLTEEKAAQYMIFASLLARRIDEATLIKKD